MHVFELVRTYVIPVGEQPRADIEAGIRDDEGDDREYRECPVPSVDFGAGQDCAVDAVKGQKRDQDQGVGGEHKGAHFYSKRLLVASQGAEERNREEDDQETCFSVE